MFDCEGEGESSERRNLHYSTFAMTHGVPTTAALSLFLLLAQVRLSSPFITPAVLPTSSVVRTSEAGCVVRTSGAGCELVSRPVEKGRGVMQPGSRGERCRVHWALDATARVEDEVDVRMATKQLKKAAKEKRIAHRVRFDLMICTSIQACCPPCCLRVPCVGLCLHPPPPC